MFQPKMTPNKNMGKRDENWYKHFKEVLAYVTEHHHLPSKYKPECHALRNWWKYNQRLLRRGVLRAEQIDLLKQIDDIRHKPVRKEQA